MKRKPYIMYSNPIYRAWMNIKNRCYQKSNVSFKDYGGKGLTVCDEWRKSFTSFYNWAISNGWEEGLTIDRIRNSEGYYPENCRWVTQAQQQRNKTNNVVITAFSETKCLVDWVKDGRCVVAFNTVRQRMDVLKWDAEKALTYPSMNKKGVAYKRDNSILIEYNNEKRNLKDWCRVLRIKYTTTRMRLIKGWGVKKSFQNISNG